MSKAGPPPVIGFVACAAGGVETVRTGYVEPALARGWRVAVTLTPTAARWLSDDGEIERLASATELPVRSDSRLPREGRPHPPADCWVVAPATANTVASLALGLAGNQALTQVCEAIGSRSTPVIVFPRVNAGHAGQPAWSGHLAALRSVGVQLIYGDDVWPLYPPRSGPPDRALPWPAILDATARALRKWQQTSPDSLSG
jgi:hypothetical protein